MATNLLDLAGYVQDQGEVGRQRRVRDVLSGAATRAFSAETPAERSAAVGEAIQADPNSGFALNTQVNADDDRRGRQIYNMARGLKSIQDKNPDAAAALYEQQLVPGLRRLGFQVQDTYDAARIMPVVDQVLAQFSNPAEQGVQSTKILENGNIGIVTRSGQVVDTGQRASPTTRLIEQDGQVPFLVTTSGGRVGETTQIGASQEPQAVLSPDLSPTDRAAIMANPQGFASAPDGGHVTAAGDRAWTANTPDPYGGNRSSPMPVRTPTAAENARATQDAKNASDIAAYERMTGLAAEREAATTTARETAEARAQKLATLPQTVAAADETIALLDRVINHPGRGAATGLTSANPLNRIPGTDAYDFNVLLDQIKGQAFLQAFQSLRGGGAITEREGQAATNAIARLNAAQSEEEFATAINDLRRIVADGKDRAIKSVAGGGASTDAPAAPEAAVPRATNPRTGETIEFRNGKWGPAR